MKKKTVALLLALVLVLGVAAGGTIAWLIDQTGTVTNTFTYGNIGITLDETKPVNKEAKIIPGVDIEKDPKVTVAANSEDCWLFVKIEEANWPTGSVATKVKYEVADGWTKGDGKDIPANVVYRKVTTSTTAQDFYVIKDNKVTVSSELTKGEIDDLKDDQGKIVQPTLSFTAYACQFKSSADKNFTAAQAWDTINPTTSGN